MDGHLWKTIVAALLVSISAGCRNTGSKTAPQTDSLPTMAAGKKQSSFGGLFASKPKPPGPTPQFQPVDSRIVEAEKNKGPLKPETIAALANAQVGAAFDFQEPGTVNPNLDRMADDARMKFQKALEADPKNKDALQGLARLYTRLGERDRAVVTLETLLKYHPNDHRSVHELALTYARFEEWGNGISACQAALASDPENRRYQRTLGLLQTRSGQFEQGFATLSAVMPEAEARFTMAKLLADMQQPELARQQLQMAVRADPTFAPAQEFLAAITRPQEPIQAVEHRETGY